MDKAARIRTLGRSAARRVLPNGAVHHARRLRVAMRHLAEERSSPVLFAFPGGAGAWDGMGTELYRAESAFRTSADACSRIAEERLGFAPAAVLGGDDSAAAAPGSEIAWRNRIVMIATVQLALWDLWISTDAPCDGVLAMSLGEVAAGYASGALSRDDAMTTACSLAHRASERPERGRLIVVAGDVDTARGLAQGAPVRLEFLGDVGPNMAVLFCVERDAAAAAAYLAASGTVMRMIETAWAFHTMIRPFDLQEFIDDLDGITSSPLRLPFYSSVTGGLLAEDVTLGGASSYWGASRPFHYGSALAAALRDGYRVIVNVGPDPTLNGAIEATASALGVHVRLIDSMRAGETDLEAWKVAKRRLRSRTSKRRQAPGPRAETVDALVGRLVFADPEFAREPTEQLAGLREASTVHFLRRQASWIAVGYDAVRSALTSPDDYATVDMAEVDATLLGADGEPHHSARRLLSRAFSPEAIDRLGAFTEEAALRLLTPLVGRAEFDVVQELAVPLPILVGGQLLGLDESTVARLRAPGGGPPRLAPSEMAAAKRRTEQLADAIPMYAELRERDRYDHDAAVKLITLLWVAATSSTSSAIGSAVLQLADRQLRDEIHSRPELLADFIEEALRLEPPAPVITRRTTRTVCLAGANLPAGATVHLMLGPANRDPARFENPDRLLLDRPNKLDHLAFAAGPHRCLGARLARAELKGVLTALLKLMPEFELVQPRHTLRYLPTMTTRALEQLVITSGRAG